MSSSWISLHHLSPFSPFSLCESAPILHAQYTYMAVIYPHSNSISLFCVPLPIASSIQYIPRFYQVEYLQEAFVITYKNMTVDWEQQIQIDHIIGVTKPSFRVSRFFFLMLAFSRIEYQAIIWGTIALRFDLISEKAPTSFVPFSCSTNDKQILNFHLDLPSPSPFWIIFHHLLKRRPKIDGFWVNEIAHSQCFQ